MFLPPIAFEAHYSEFAGKRATTQTEPRISNDDSAVASFRTLVLRPQRLRQDRSLYQCCNLVIRTVLIALTSVLTLSNASRVSAADVTLLFWPGPESEAMQKVVDSYNAGTGKADGTTVKQLLFSRQGYFEKELADMAAKSDQCDLALLFTYSVGKYASFLSPIDQFVTKDGSAKFFPVALRGMSYDGKLFGLPTDISINL